MLLPLASTIGDIAASVAAVATVGLLVAASIAGVAAWRQLGGLTQQLQHQRKADGRRRVYEHLSRLFDRDFIKMDTEAQRLFRTRPAPPDAAAWKTLWDSKSESEKAKIMSTMNFYEVVAGEYNDTRQELLDKSTADKALVYIADQMWTQAEPFVRWLRTEYKEDRAYEEWEQLHLTFTGAQGASTSSSAASLANPAGTSTTAVHPASQAGAGAERAPAAGAGESVGKTPAAAGAGEGVVKPPAAEADASCPEDPCVVMPRRVLVVAVVWAIAIVAMFFAYIEIDAVADFFPAKVGSLPISAIWFGAAGGLLVSLEGIFKYNRRWLRSYDYWHYLRPLLGALMGTLGCLVFIVLTSAATSNKALPTDATFYAVIALGLGYREAGFRTLLARLIDTVIIPADQGSAGSTTGTSAAGSSRASS